MFRTLPDGASRPRRRPSRGHLHVRSKNLRFPPLRTISWWWSTMTGCIRKRYHWRKPKFSPRQRRLVVRPGSAQARWRSVTGCTTSTVELIPGGPESGGGSRVSNHDNPGAHSRIDGPFAGQFVGVVRMRDYRCPFPQHREASRPTNRIPVSSRSAPRAFNSAHGSMTPRVVTSAIGT